MTEIERLMIKARTSLLLSQPFFGTLSLRLRMIEDATVETAEVDGKEMRYNPDFVKALTHAQRVGLICHETMHCAAGHFMRQGNREHERFNEAGDYAINPMIVDAGMELPEGGLLDRQWDGMSAEEIYAKLPPRPPGAGGPGTGNVGGCGVFRQPKDPDDPQRKQPASLPQQQALARDWKIATMQAAAVARRAGSMPGSAEELVEAMKAPKVDWREALKRFVTSLAQDDYSWMPPNRRYAAQGLYLPSLRSERIGDLVFAVDTSISMNTEALQQALAEFNAILDDVQPDVVHYIECDTDIGHEREFTPDDYPVVSQTMAGRGGTAFAPVFAKIAERDITPACLIYFTDLDCTNFGPEPNYPVLWASTLKDEAPFGEVIKVI